LRGRTYCADVLCPAAIFTYPQQTRRKLLDAEPLSADSWAHRATRVASDVIERMAHGEQAQLGAAGSVPPADDHRRPAFRGYGHQRGGRARRTLVTCCEGAAMADRALPPTRQCEPTSLGMVFARADARQGRGQRTTEHPGRSRHGNHHENDSSGATAFLQPTRIGVALLLAFALAKLGSSPASALPPRGA